MIIKKILNFVQHKFSNKSEVTAQFVPYYIEVWETRLSSAGSFWLPCIYNRRYRKNIVFFANLLTIYIFKKWENLKTKLAKKKKKSENFISIKNFGLLIQLFIETGLQVLLNFIHFLLTFINA